MNLILECLTHCIVGKDIVAKIFAGAENQIFISRNKEIYISFRTNNKSFGILVP